MKAITLHQPWATLIAIGEKRFETRSWATKYRGSLAVHAAKRIDIEACKREPIKSVLSEHSYTVDNLPTGAIIAMCHLNSCYEIGEVNVKQKEASFKWSDEFIWGNEFDYGWYEDGRFAWELVDVKRVEPIPANGQQRIWNWDGSY